MHKSLSRGTNRLLIALWATGVLTLGLVTRGAIALTVVSGAACGVVAGLLQRSALRERAAAFAATATALDVRRVLIASSSGKIAIVMVWVCGPIVLPLAIFLQRNGHVAASWFAGHLAFMLVREALTYPALRAVWDAADEVQRRQPTSH